MTTDVGVRAPGHFLQSAPWARFQRALGRRVERLDGDGWSALAVVERGRAGRRVYVPYGPVITRRGAYPEAIDALMRLARSERAMLIRVEPIGEVDADEILACRGRRAGSTQPARTNRVDLRDGWEAVTSRMTQHARRASVQYPRRGISVRRSDDPADIEILLRFLDEVAERTGMRLHPPQYLRTQAQALLPGGDAAIYIAELGAEPVAAALVYLDAERAYYAHAGAAMRARAANPGTAVIARSMQDAIEAGRLEYDLYGVAPPGVVDHPWAGFSAFKRTFGGVDVEYLGAWEHDAPTALGALRRLVVSVLR